MTMKENDDVREYNYYLATSDNFDLQTNCSILYHFLVAMAYIHAYVKQYVNLISNQHKFHTTEEQLLLPLSNGISR